jgi:YD repeat-containing protein
VDLVLWDVVPVIFSRTYRTADSRSRPFGVGANHSYGSFLVGDAPVLTWIDLILPDGGRIHYRRTSPGTGLDGAVLRNTDSPTEYLQSVLSYNGREWTIQLQDGARFTYPECPPEVNKACTLSGYQDAAGHRLQFTHDNQFNLIRIDTEQHRSLQLEYDTEDRIIRAWTSFGDEVRYSYDAGGRLVRVVAATGESSEYEYDMRDEMVTIKEPGLFAVNEYDEGGRCVHQDLHFYERGPDGQISERRAAFTFSYTTDTRGRITGADVIRPENVRRHVTFNTDGYVTSERASGRQGDRGVIYTRDDESDMTRQLTVWCGPGQRVRVSAPVRREDAQATISGGAGVRSGEDALKARMDQTCQAVLTPRVRRSN